MTYAKTNIRTRTRKTESQKKGRRAVFKLLLTMLLILNAFLLINLTVKNANASPANFEPRNKYYTSIGIEQGETLWDVAAEYCSYEYSDYYEYISEVMNINKLSSEYVKTGAVICIPYYADEPLTDML